ncbi:hypothetical protein [Ekhidna sp.]|uniref:hypothetical protein n=1 Tax=Ekhidna sp. TaxID=2608089 RepID=UPI003B5A86C3
MENESSLDLSDQRSYSSLPGWGFALLLFIVLASLINYVYFKEIFLVSEGREDDFILKNFLVYNLGLKAILYPFKFLALAGMMMMGAFLFKVEQPDFSNLLKIVVLAELVKYLPEISKILWFTFFNADNLVGYETGLFDNYLSLNGLLGITKENTIYPLFKYLSITQVLYVLAVAQLLKGSTDENLSHHLYWFGITYGTIVLLLGLGSTVISL